MSRPLAFVSAVALVAACAIAVTVGCGHTPCNTNADCPSDQVCNAEACVKKSTPTAPPPSECGDRCTIDATRCDWMANPADTKYQRCTVGSDACSHWTDVETCGQDRWCYEGMGCVPGLTEGATCGAGSVPCSGDLVCASLAPFGGPAESTCRRACKAGCAASERCVDYVCVPAGSCDDCDPGLARCANMQSPEHCEWVARDCTRWIADATCTGSNVCTEGQCVGTVASGGACSDVSACRAGLVCLSDTATCKETCTDSASCAGGTLCRFTTGSRGSGICAGGSSPPLSATCTVHVGHLEVFGEFDDNTIIGLGVTPPDPYVELAGGGYYATTSVFTDTATVDFDADLPPISFADLFASTLSVMDSDTPFSAADLVTSWRLVDQFAWDSATRSFSLTLMAPSGTLGATVTCVDR